MRFPDPSVMVNVESGSPVPLIVGVESLVMRFSVGLEILGAVGAVVSIWIGKESAGLILPVASVAFAVRVVSPSGSADEGV